MPDTVTWTLISILFLLIWFSRSDEVRQQRIEQKLNALLKHLNIDLNPNVDPQVKELAYAGNKIGAVKLYRERTGASLAEAKQVIDGL